MFHIYGGITLGSVLAVLISWSHNHSIMWAIIDFFLSWVYVVYALIGFPPMPHVMAIFTQVLNVATSLFHALLALL